MPLQRGAGAEGYDRAAVARADLDDRRRLLAALDEGDGVGCRDGMIGLVAVLLLAHRQRRRPAIAKKRLSGRALMKANEKTVKEFGLDVAAEFIPEAIFTLVACMRDEKAKWSDRRGACTEILNRSEGTPGKSRDRNTPSGVIVVIQGSSGLTKEAITVTANADQAMTGPEAALANVDGTSVYAVALVLPCVISPAFKILIVASKSSTIVSL